MYCLNCKKNIKQINPTSSICPLCGKDLKEKLSPDEKTALVQALHKRENDVRDHNDTAMSFLVLGAIFLVIGAIFFTLSYKPISVNDNTKILQWQCFEFWVAVLSLGGGGLSFLYGLVRVIIGTRVLRVLCHDIAEINEKSTTIVDKTPLWIREFSFNLRVRILNAAKIKRVEATSKKKK